MIRDQSDIKKGAVRGNFVVRLLTEQMDILDALQFRRRILLIANENEVRLRNVSGYPGQQRKINHIGPQIAKETDYGFRNPGQIIRRFVLRQIMEVFGVDPMIEVHARPFVNACSSASRLLLAYKVRSALANKSLSRASKIAVFASLYSECLSERLYIRHRRFIFAITGKAVGVVVKMAGS